MIEYTEEQKTLLMMKGLISEAPPEERVLVDDRIAKLKEMSSDEIGQIALAFVVAERAAEVTTKGTK